MTAIRPKEKAGANGLASTQYCSDVCPKKRDEIYRVPPETFPLCPLASSHYLKSRLDMLGNYFGPSEGLPGVFSTG